MVHGGRTLFYYLQLFARLRVPAVGRHGGVKVRRWPPVADDLVVMVCVGGSSDGMNRVGSMRQKNVQQQQITATRVLQGSNLRGKIPVDRYRIQVYRLRWGFGTTRPKTLAMWEKISHYLILNNFLFS